MQAYQVSAARGLVHAAIILGEPVPGWRAELAKYDPIDPPEGTLAEFIASLPDTVPEWAPYTPPPKRQRWRFWRYW